MISSLEATKALRQEVEEVDAPKAALADQIRPSIVSSQNVVAPEV